jgi:hypothetical protein
LAFTAGLAAFKLYNYPRNYQTAEKIFHAHYTAGLIEDEIRRIRDEDFAYRKRYEELKQEQIDKY